MSLEDKQEEKVVLDKFEVGIEDGMLIVFVAGEATHSESPAVKDLITDSIKKEMQGVKKVGMHLQNCNYMDSTFMGTLMVIDKTSLKHLDDHVIIINPSQFCENLLEQMGLHNYLPIDRNYKDYEGEKWNITALELSRLDKALHLLEAHQELSAINEENRKQFSLIEKLLRQDIKNLRSEDQKKD